VNNCGDSGCANNNNSVDYPFRPISRQSQQSHQSALSVEDVSSFSPYHADLSCLTPSSSFGGGRGGGGGGQHRVPSSALPSTEIPAGTDGAILESPTSQQAIHTHTRVHTPTLILTMFVRQYVIYHIQWIVG